jgi:hypothetical protein
MVWCVLVVSLLFWLFKSTKCKFHIWPTYSTSNQSYVRYNPLQSFQHCNFRTDYLSSLQLSFNIAMHIWNPVHLDRIEQSVHTGTYQYVPVQHGIRQYENLTVVRNGMYLYIPVRTLKKTSCFLTHPERVRRDKIQPVQLLCMGYNVAKSNFKTAQD